MVEIWAYKKIVAVNGLAATGYTQVDLGLTGTLSGGNEGRPYRISRLEVCAIADNFGNQEKVLLFEGSLEPATSEYGFDSQYNNNNELVERAKQRNVGKLIGLVNGIAGQGILNNGVPVAVTPNRSYEPSAGDAQGIIIYNPDNAALSGGTQEVLLTGKAYGVWL